MGAAPLEASGPTRAAPARKPDALRRFQRRWAATRNLPGRRSPGLAPGPAAAPL